MKAGTSKAPQTGKGRKANANPARTKASLRIASILVPIDFSKASFKALQYAATLAEMFHAKLTLLYVNEPVAAAEFGGASVLMKEDDELISAYRSNLSKVAQGHRIDPARIEKVLVRQGRAYHEITEAARTLKVDIIVISTHGYTGLSHVLLGSVTERVVRHAPCPVLVVRENEHEFISAMSLKPKKETKL